MSGSRALQKAVVTALRADATVAGLVGARVYDMPPAAAVYPFVSLGPSSSVPADDECIDAREESLQIDIWDRSNGLMHPCRAITDAVYAALHEISLTLDDPYANVETNVTTAQVFMDPDGLTAHGVVQIIAMVETI